MNPNPTMTAAERWCDEQNIGCNDLLFEVYGGRFNATWARMRDALPGLSEREIADTLYGLYASKRCNLLKPSPYPDGRKARRR